jgi:hypothetical protein
MISGWQNKCHVHVGLTAPLLWLSASWVRLRKRGSGSEPITGKMTKKHRLFASEVGKESTRACPGAEAVNTSKLYCFPLDRWPPAGDQPNQGHHNNGSKKCDDQGCQIQPADRIGNIEQSAG